MYNWPAPTAVAYFVSTLKYEKVSFYDFNSLASSRDDLICLCYSLGRHNSHTENDNGNANDNVDISDSASRQSQSRPTMGDRILERSGIHVLQKATSRKLLSTLLFVTWIFWNICVFDCSTVQCELSSKTKTLRTLLASRLQQRW